MKPIEKFQSILRDLFQFDCADLDFGIYRIMNRKRAVVEHYIAEELQRCALAAGDKHLEYRYELKRN
jgi:adenine-specific DNA-methyltransferase